MQTKELKVLKFGGSSLSDAAQIRKAEAIIAPIPPTASWWSPRRASARPGTPR
jgi:hypothetical protein